MLIDEIKIFPQTKQLLASGKFHLWVHLSKNIVGEQGDKWNRSLNRQRFHKLYVLESCP